MVSSGKGGRVSIYRSIIALLNALLRADGTPVSIGKRVIVGMFFCKGEGIYG